MPIAIIAWLWNGKHIYCKWIRFSVFPNHLEPMHQCMSSIIWARTCPGQMTHQHYVSLNALMAGHWAQVEEAGILWPGIREMTLQSFHSWYQTPNWPLVVLWVEGFYFAECQKRPPETVGSSRERTNGVLSGRAEEFREARTEEIYR